MRTLRVVRKVSRTSVALLAPLGPAPWLARRAARALLRALYTSHVRVVRAGAASSGPSVAPLLVAASLAPSRAAASFVGEFVCQFLIF